jgi:hypothetical protein
MNKLLLEYVHTILTEAEQSQAAKQAHNLGLVKVKGFGLWGKKKDGPATHKTVDGKLVPVHGQQPEPKKKKSYSSYKDKNKEFARQKRASVSGTSSHSQPKQSKDTEGGEQELFAYLPPRSQAARMKSLQNLETIVNLPDLSKEQKVSAKLLQVGIHDILKAYSRYRVSGGKDKKAKEEIIQKAHELNDKFKFFSNSAGTSFKTKEFGMRHRHFLAPGGYRKPDGSPSNLAVEMVDIFEMAGIDVKNAEQGDKKLKRDLSTASKPSMGAAVHSIDTTVGKGKDKKKIPGSKVVQSVFKSMQFIDEEYRQLFGPTSGDPPELIDNTGGKNAKAYFEHSVKNNVSLQETEMVLRESGMVEMADALKEHHERMVQILDTFDNTSPQDRERLVQQSYAQMAIKLHKRPGGDPELCNSIMKNIAEINLYDQEIAAGKEVYLPAHGSFPGADKLVRTDAGTEGERIQSISVKYGKNGKVYGMYAQSNTILLYHPDKIYHNVTSGRPGRTGYELGVRADCLEKENWNRFMRDSGYSTVFSPQEVELLRSKFEEISHHITQQRDKIGKFKNKDIQNILEKTMSKHKDEMLSLIFGNPPSEERIQKMTELFGTERLSLLKRLPLAFPSMLVVDSAIITGNGFPQLSHCHQEIGDRGTGDPDFIQEVEAGTSKLECWHFNFRAADERSGGLIMGYHCGE